jgi:DNA-binding MarR family transcriptional regulator
MPRAEAADPFRMAGTLLLLVRSLAHDFRQSEDDMDLADLSVLRQIERGRDLPSAVARALRIDPGRVSRIVDRLEKDGYVARRQDPDDRRCWHLHLTAGGAERLARGKDEIRVAMSALLQGLSDDELAALETGLESVRRELETPVPSKTNPAPLAP